MAKEPDYVPMSCAAGVVEQAGAGVTRVKPGDRVSPQFSQGWIDGPPGAYVAITSSSEAKLARAKVLGADVGVNYRTTPDWAAAVRSKLGGADVLADRAASRWRRSIWSTSPWARIPPTSRRWPSRRTPISGCSISRAGRTSAK